MLLIANPRQAYTGRESVNAKFELKIMWVRFFETRTNRSVTSLLYAILFLSCTTNALLGYSLDGHLSKPHPFLSDFCGLARYRCSR